MDEEIQNMKTAFELFGDVLRKVPIRSLEEPSAALFHRPLVKKRSSLSISASLDKGRSSRLHDLRPKKMRSMSMRPRRRQISAEVQRKLDGDAAEALRKLSRAISLCEDDRFYAILGFILSDNFGLSAEAEANFQKAISINPLRMDVGGGIKTPDIPLPRNDKQLQKLFQEGEKKKIDVASTRDIKRKTIKLSELNSILSVLDIGWDGTGNLERITKELGLEKHVLFHSRAFSTGDKDAFFIEHIADSLDFSSNSPVVEVRNLDIEESGELTLTRGGVYGFYYLDWKRFGHNYLFLNNRFKGDDVTINYGVSYPSIFCGNEFSDRVVFQGMYPNFDPIKGVRVTKEYLGARSFPVKYNLILSNNAFKDGSFIIRDNVLVSDDELNDEEVILPSILNVILYKNKIESKINLLNLSDAKFKGNLINQIFMAGAQAEAGIFFFGENKINYIDIDSSLTESPQCEFQFHVHDIFDEELNNARHHKKLFIKLKKKAAESEDSQQSALIDAQFLSHFEIGVGGWGLGGNQSVSKANQDIFMELFARVQVKLKEQRRSASVGAKMEKTSEAMCEFLPEDRYEFKDYIFPVGDDDTETFKVLLPIYVKNVIGHPENKDNDRVSPSEIQDSITMLRAILHNMSNK